MRTLSVAGVNSIKRVLRGQGFGQLSGLPLASVVERNVELTLNAGVDVPSRLAMSNGNDSGGFHLSWDRDVDPTL